MFLFKYYRAGHNVLCLICGVLYSLVWLLLLKTGLQDNPQVQAFFWVWTTYCVISTLLFPSAIFCCSWIGAVTKGHYDDQLILRRPQGSVFESGENRARRFSNLLKNIFILWPIFFVTFLVPLFGIIGLIRAYFASNHD